jgi:hypothetical protein
MLLAMTYDRSLPRHRVVARDWRLTAWCVGIPAAMAIAALATMWWLWQTEAARSARASSELQKTLADEAKLSVVFDGDGVICKVSQWQERAAVHVRFQCESLIQSLKVAGVAK